MQERNSWSPETPTDVTTDLYRPSDSLSSNAPYVMARKEITLSKITDFDLALVSLWDNIADACKDMGLPRAASMHEHQLFFWINAKRSVGGFERMEQGKIKTEIGGSVDYKGKAPTQVIVPQ